MKRRLAMLVVLIMILTAFAVPVAADSDSDCIYTQGYWKNHVDAWNDDACPTIGGIDSQSEWLGILRTPPKGDPWVILAHQYIAAYLNELDSIPMDLVADILGMYGPGEIPEDLEEQALYLANLLDDFNNNGY